MAIEYLTMPLLKEQLAKVVFERSEKCAGFNIQRPSELYRQPPKHGVHFDASTGKPITVVCEHGANGERCQTWAEMLYILISAFAKHDINGPQWMLLFPTRTGETYRGYPEFAPYTADFPRCFGFKPTVCDAMLDHSFYFEDNPLRLGREVNPVTLTMFTRECNHSVCDDTALVRFALVRAFATGLMLDFGLDIHDDILPDSGN